MTFSKFPFDLLWDFQNFLGICFEVFLVDSHLLLSLQLFFMKWADFKQPIINFRVSEGQIVRGYNSPDPAAGSGPHRFVFLALKQLGGRFDNVPTNTEDICKNDGRDNFDLVRLNFKLRWNSFRKYCFLLILWINLQQEKKKVIVKLARV